MPRRSVEAAQQTREAILLSGREVFAERGYAASGTREIASRAGVTEGALFHHFASKKDLFREVFVELEQALDAAARQASRRGAPIEAFLAGSRAALAFAGEPAFVRIVMTDGPVVFGDEEWHALDHGLGLPTVRQGLRNLSPYASDRAIAAMAVMVMGALNEFIRALARGEPGLDVESCIEALRRLLLTWEPRA